MLQREMGVIRGIEAEPRKGGRFRLSERRRKEPERGKGSICHSYERDLQVPPITDSEYLLFADTIVGPTANCSAWRLSLTGCLTPARPRFRALPAW